MRAIEIVLQHARRHHDLLMKSASRVECMAAGCNSIDELRLKNPDLLKKARSVEIESYKIKGYMRLVPFKSLLVGTYKSKHLIPDLVGLHFKKRYPSYHVLTWNEGRRDGCLSLASNLGAFDELRRWMQAMPVDAGAAKDVLIRGGLHVFQLPISANFADDFLPRVIQFLFPGDEEARTHVHDKKAFETQWASFYDTQVIASRIDYKRAMSMIGKRQLLDQIGIDSIEAQRVLKKVTKDQKTLLDYK